MNPAPIPRHRAPFFLVGPTASGKSTLALALAERLGGEIINADAFQLYADLAVCTARPSPADLQRAPHHLYGVLPPSESCNAQRYADLARKTISDVISRNRIPIVTGGSGLYVKSLTHGLSPLPSSQDLRAKLCHLTANERVVWLLTRDPDAASTVNLLNDRHVTRALEICLLTGRPQSELRRAWRETAPHFTGVCLAMDRSLLDARIDERVRDMLGRGLIDEIRTLPPLSPTAEMAIGIHEVRRHLAGLSSLQEMIAAIQLATRQYARRQIKWFRRETGFAVIQVARDSNPAQLVEDIISRFPSLQTAPPR